MLRENLKKGRCEHIEIMCVIMLFLVLTVMSLLLVMAGSNNYKKIKTQTDRTFNNTALLSYITNKINGGDNGHIFVETHDGNNVLVLENDNVNFKTFIYKKDEKIYEIIVSYDTNFSDTLEGEYMYDIKDIEFKQIGEKLISIKIITDEEEKSVYVALKATC